MTNTFQNHLTTNDLIGFYIQFQKKLKGNKGKKHFMPQSDLYEANKIDQMIMWISPF